MILLLILIGLLIPTINGWLLLGLLQNRTPVLFRGERASLGFLIGVTLTMFLVFCIHIVFGLSLSFTPLFIIQAFMGIMLSAAMRWKKIPFLAARETLAAERWSMLQKLAIGILGTWTIVKIATLGITFLFLTPTYFDDSVDNWNLRAKVFYHTQSIELLLPGRGDTPADVSSYPPTVPMAKAWMAMTAGWGDATVNAIHAAWFLCALSLLYYALRRYLSGAWSLFGIYVIVSMPLYLMHGTNAYADIFMGTHVFAAIILLFHAIHSPDAAARDSFLRMAGAATAFLPFTKNEGLLLYLPPVLLIVAGYLIVQRKNMTAKEISRIALWYAIPILLISVPWLAYKYANGLTFGNAKAVGDLAFGWQPGVLYAVWVNTFFEGNWLLLFPVLIALLAWRRRSAFVTLLPITALFLIVYLGQLAIYMFTSVSIEAIRQTGYARGIIQLLPVMVFLTVMLLKDAYDRLRMH